MQRRIKHHRPAPDEIQRVAEDIYIYAYPLLLIDAVKRMRTATSCPTPGRAPLNQFAHGRFLSGPQDKHAVRPNADCLSSSAWLDLSRGPVVLSVPRSHRYHLLSFVSGWYEIFETHSPRNAGTQGGHLGFAGPRWRGRLPVGMRRIVAPTETVWIDGLFEADGAEDIELVHREQDQFRLTPLSEWGRPSMPHGLPFRMDVDRYAMPQEQVDRLDARGFYTRLSGLIQKNPPQAWDAEIVAGFARIGFFPCEDFDFEMLPPDTAQAMQRAVASAQSRIANAGRNAERGKLLHNWSLHVHPGRYHRNYLDRAVTARSGIAAALAEDVLCLDTAVDRTGEPLNGANRYVIHFCRDALPPVNAFWSITLYDSRQHLVPNTIHRNAIGDRDRLRHNPDNSLSIHVQHDWPGTSRDSNWLPAPAHRFNLVLRMYWPKPDAFTGNWRPPAVMRTN